MTTVHTYHSNQIGGCVVSIETDTTKIVIDFGENLSGSNSGNIEIEGLTYGEKSYDGVFFTHYHGDHIGRMKDILDGIPLYIGSASRVILRTIAKALKNDSMLELLDSDRIVDLSIAKPVQVGDIKVTPYLVDHSAYEAFLFLIETKDKTIVHTGDFREHGYRGNQKLIQMIRKYITRDGKRPIDILITEGTMLSRLDTKPYTEMDLQRDAYEFFKTHKYVFLICSSTNVDSLASFYQAGQKNGMHMYCNWYVEEQLKNYRKIAGAWSALYDFKNVHQWHPDQTLKSNSGWTGTQFDLLLKYGFVTVIKGNSDYGRWIDEFEKRSGKKAAVIYSMWEGYIKPGKCYDEELATFCKKYQAVSMHTSGHAYVEAIEEVINTINPRESIIPIHTENAEGFFALNIRQELKERIVFEEKKI